MKKPSSNSRLILADRDQSEGDLRLVTLRVFHVPDIGKICVESADRDMTMMKLALLNETRALLRAALNTAERSGDALIWAQIGQAFGHVGQQIRTYQIAGGHGEDIPVTSFPPHVCLLDDRQRLKEAIFETITLAEAAGSYMTVPHLNAALATVSPGEILDCPANER